jgi:hypothetical protein
MLFVRCLSFIPSIIYTQTHIIHYTIHYTIHYMSYVICDMNQGKEGRKGGRR